MDEQGRHRRRRGQRRACRAAHAARERGCARARAREGRPGVVGRQLGVHRRRDPPRPRRPRRPARASSRTTSASRAHRPRPVHRGGLPRRHAARDAGARRRGDGADPRRATPARAVRWLRERGLRFRLMYERQAYEVDGRHRFWGGLAVGTVDGGEGLMAQHRAAAERTGIELRHGVAVDGPRCATTRARARRGRADADGARRSCAPARSCSRPAASRPTRACAPPTSGRTGTSRRSAGRRTTPARCSRPRSPTARRPTGTGAAATRSSGTPTRRRPATARSRTASRASPIRSGIVDGPHLDAMLARIAHDLRRRVEAHRLRIQQRAAKTSPGGGTSSTPRHRRAVRSSRHGSRESRSRRSPRSGGSSARRNPVV